MTQNEKNARIILYEWIKQNDLDKDEFDIDEIALINEKMCELISKYNLHSESLFEGLLYDKSHGND